MQTATFQPIWRTWEDDYLQEQLDDANRAHRELEHKMEDTLFPTGLEIENMKSELEDLEVFIQALIREQWRRQIP